MIDPMLNSIIHKKNTPPEQLKYYKQVTDGFRGRHMLLHRLIAEKALGRPLPTSVPVHHVSGKDFPGYSVICQDLAYHNLLHYRAKALRESGHVNWCKCLFWKSWDDPKNLTKYIQKTKNRYYHKICNANNHRERRRRENASH